MHQSIFACMAVGWSLASHSPWPLLLGGLAVAGTLGVAAIASRRFINGEALVGADRTWRAWSMPSRTATSSI